jgi:hypothetical protein
LARTDQRLAGNRVIPDRLVSLSDPTPPDQPEQTAICRPSWHKLLLAEDQRGLVADTSLRRQREPA